MRKNLIMDSKAATAVEFALVAPILFLLIFAIIEITSVMLATSVLEDAVRAAGRAGITGYVPAGQTRDQYILGVVDANLVYLNPNNITFTKEVYQSFADIGQPEPYTDSAHVGHYVLGDPYTDVNGNGQWDADMGAAGDGGPGDIVVYKITYPWQIISPLIAKFSGQFNITASIVVRNEPYGS